MDEPRIEIRTLARYVDAESERWRAWFAGAGPGVLDLPLGAGAGGESVRTLVQHIFAVELRYAQRLLGESVTEYDQLDAGSVDSLWAVHARAAALRDRYLAGATAQELGRTLSFDTRRAGRLEARAHTVLVHSLMHSVRHWAQVATVLRQHGHGKLWEHDWLVSPAVQ